RKQEHLPAKVVPDLDGFLRFELHAVDLVVALRLEEKMADLSRPHGDGPAENRGLGDVEGDERVRREKAARAQEVERLVDAAPVVEAVVVPALLLQLLEKRERACDCGSRHVRSFWFEVVRLRSGSPTRIVSPSRTLSAKRNGPFANTRIVDPLSKNPSSRPFSTGVSRRSIFR